MTKGSGKTYVVADVISGNEISITKEQFAAAEAARTLFGFSTAAEENFDAVMENYATLERSLLSLAIDQLCFGMEYPQDMFIARSQTARHIMNLLTSCRLFEHTIVTNAGGVDKSLKKHFRPILERLPKEYFEVRFAQALRNYAQHTSLPAHSITFNRRWTLTDQNEKDKAPHSVEPAFLVREAIADGRFDSEVLKEVKALGEKLVLMPPLRKYVEILGGLMADMRDKFRPFEAKAEQEIDVLKRSYLEAFPGEKIETVVAARAGSDMKPEETVYLDHVPNKYLPFVRRKNRSTVNLSRRLVEWV